MKKIILYISCFIFLISCDKDGNSLSTNYIILNARFSPEDIANNYRVIFNGSEDKYIPADEMTGTLEVFSKADNALIFTEKNLTVTDDGFTFIKPLGKELAIYSDNKYININPKIIFAADAALYNVQFKGNEVSIAQDNYISKDELPGDLKIVDKESATELYSQNLTDETSGTINIMQISAAEFLRISDAEDSDPADNAFKIRFFYTADAFPGQEKLIFDFYLTDKKGKNTTFFKSMELEKGQLSEYIEVDNNYFNDGNNVVNGYFDLKDKDGNLIVDHTVNTKATIVIGSNGSTYKFITFRFTNTTPEEGSGARATRLMDLWVVR